MITEILGFDFPYLHLLISFECLTKHLLRITRLTPLSHNPAQETKKRSACRWPRFSYLPKGCFAKPAAWPAVSRFFSKPPNNWIPKQRKFWRVSCDHWSKMPNCQRWQEVYASVLVSLGKQWANGKCILTWANCPDQGQRETNITPLFWASNVVCSMYIPIDNRCQSSWSVFGRVAHANCRKRSPGRCVKIAAAFLAGKCEKSPSNEHRMQEAQEVLTKPHNGRRVECLAIVRSSASTK